MKTQKHIGIDLGGESGRVMLGHFDGDQIRLTEKHRFATGGVEIAEILRWDVLHSWREIRNGLSSVAADRYDGVTSVGVVINLPRPPSSARDFSIRPSVC